MGVKLRSRQFAREGLVFLELLTVIGILAMLIALLIPMFIRAQEQSGRIRCQNQLREIGQAILSYRNDNRGRFPLAASDMPPATESDNPDNEAEEPVEMPELRPDNVSAAIFLLLRTHNLSPGLFVCPSTNAVPDDFGGLPRWKRSDFTDVKRNLSYSMQNPCANGSVARAGFLWSRFANPDFVIMADINPGICGIDDHVLAVTPNSPPNIMRWGNSNNHAKRGQNVLYADGRAAFVDNPFVGVDHDNIYTTKNSTILDAPADEDDSVLLPTDD
jgi:type II secretory pathway pseudopilin PulG